MIEKNKCIFNLIEPGHTDWKQVLEDKVILKQAAKFLEISEIEIQLEELKKLQKDYDERLLDMWQVGDVYTKAADVLAAAYIRKSGVLRELHWTCALGRKKHPYLIAREKVYCGCPAELLSLTWTSEHCFFTVESYNCGKQNYKNVFLRFDDGDITLGCSDVGLLWRFLQEWGVEADMSELEQVVNEAKVDFETKQNVLDSFRKNQDD